MALMKKPADLGQGGGLRNTDLAGKLIGSEDTQAPRAPQALIWGIVVFPDCLARPFGSDAERRAFLREGAR